MTTVLVVDDSATDRRLVGGLLEEGSSVDVAYAHDGSHALETIGQSPPDIVVTDLNMPGLNGLDLVEAVRSAHPMVPVVLITGQGSEELAVKALKKGAASYVPKTAMARDLLPTVMHVLALSRANQDFQEMQTCWKESRCRFELPNHYQLISPLVSQIRQMVDGMQLFDETERVQLSMALEEAISNGLYHGNLELSAGDLESIEYDLFDADSPTIVEQRKNTPPYRHRKVFVDVVLTRGEARFVVRDEGPGFDHAAVPAPGDLVASHDRSGRGLTHMRLFSDELTFNEKGNEVTLVKRCHQ